MLRIYRQFRNYSRYFTKWISNKYWTNRYKKLVLSKMPDYNSFSGLGLVLDIGANKGHFSSAAIALGFNVIAIEPHPEAFKFLHKRFKNKSNIVLKREALSNYEGEIKLNFHPAHFNDKITTSISASTIDDKFKIEQSIFSEVKCSKLSNYFANGEYYNIVKIDIEGEEMNLVNDLIAHHKQINYLFLETHHKFMNKSRYSNNYIFELNKLSKFIVDCKLTNWHTDWI